MNMCKLHITKQRIVGINGRPKLQWLNVVDRVRLRPGVQLSAQHGSGISVHSPNPSAAFLVAPPLQSADRGHLDFPGVRLATYGGRVLCCLLCVCYAGLLKL